MDFEEDANLLAMDLSTWRLASLETDSFSSTSWNQAPVTAIPELVWPNVWVPRRIRGSHFIRHSQPQSLGLLESLN